MSERTLCGRSVQTLEHRTPDADLVALRDTVEQWCQRHARPIRCLEVGSWVGESAVAICDGFGEHGGSLLCVDHWEGTETDSIGEVASRYPWWRIHELFILNTEGLPVSWVKGASLDVAASLPEDQRFDLMFLDAEHTYEAVKADFNAWLPRLDDGGVIVGHDYHYLFRGVQRFVRELGREGAKVIPRTSVWVWEKP